VFKNDDPPHARSLRDHLIDRVVALGVRDPRVLKAMRDVPRHFFTIENDLERAYADHPLSIGHNATISQPSLVGIMSEALELTGEERVLEIGTGSGYQAAVLSLLAGHVDTVEVIRDLAERATVTLANVGCTNVDVHMMVLLMIEWSLRPRPKFCRQRSFVN
jgi:protein-L-isoaspartate(D-aspartate) O-methyltransferase